VAHDVLVDFEISIIMVEFISNRLEVMLFPIFANPSTFERQKAVQF